VAIYTSAKVLSRWPINDENTFICVFSYFDFDLSNFPEEAVRDCAEYCVDCLWMATGIWIPVGLCTYLDSQSMKLFLVLRSYVFHCKQYLKAKPKERWKSEVLCSNFRIRTLQISNPSKNHFLNHIYSKTPKEILLLNFLLLNYLQLPTLIINHHPNSK
jgi:hypothetical protein